MTSERGSKTSLERDESQESHDKDDTAGMERHDHSRHGTQTSIKSTEDSKTGKESKIKEEKESDGTVDNDKDTEVQAEEERGRGHDEDDEDGRQEDDTAHDGDENDREPHDDDAAGSDGVTADWEEPERVDPRDFDSREFLSSVDKLMENLRDVQFRAIDESFPAKDVSRMVGSVRTTLANFNSYSLHTHNQLEKLREQLKEIKDRMFKKIQSRPYDPRSANQRMSLEERELEAKVTQLNKELARCSEDVVRAAQTTTETEESAVQAALVAEQAAETARQIQEEYEARRKADQEAREAEEERRRLQNERKEEEARRLEEKRKAEEARRSRLTKPHDHDANVTPEWEKWPTSTYRVDANQFDQGVGCIVRGNPNNFQENQMRCERLRQLDTTFTCEDSEELVGNIIRLTPSSDGEHLQSPIFVVMPHCTSRASAMTREAVIKAEVKDGQWVALQSTEITLEGYKDMKFVQAELSQYCVLAVVTRHKRDYLQMGKKGGRVVSNVDSRVTLTADRGTFQAKENFVVQLQPVDSSTMKEITHKKAECKGLLTSSSIVSMEWTSKEFAMPIKMTLPCPANPVTAKRAAAARAAKEAKLKSPIPPPAHTSDNDEKRQRRRKKEVRITADDEPATKPTKWYMGRYGNNDDDENDQLFFIHKQSSGRWVVMEDMPLLQVKLDIVQLQLRGPIDRFLILRVRTSVDGKEAQAMAHAIEHQLNQRTVHTIVKQMSGDQTQVILQVTPVAKSERILRQLQEDGYDDGPEVGGEVSMKEGDHLCVSFRGNIHGTPDTTPMLEMPFNSNLNSCLTFSIDVLDKFLQKSYDVYRGFVQVQKKVKTMRKPTKQELEDGLTGMVEEVVDELVSEHLVHISKDLEQELQQAQQFQRKKAPVILRNGTDPVNNDTLRHLANELRDEWQMVAHHLRVKRMRIQAIVVDNHFSEDGDEAIKYEMLLTWAKKVPRGMSKVEILKNALALSGRSDLAKELQDLNDGFQSRKHDADYEQETRQGQEIEAQ